MPLDIFLCKAMVFKALKFLTVVNSDADKFRNF